MRVKQDLAMHFTFTPEETAFRQELREFLKAELPPDWKGADEDGRTDDVELSSGTCADASSRRNGSPWPGPGSTAGRTPPA